MDNIEWFFNLHDKNKDGSLTKDEVLTVSESLLVCELFFGTGKAS
jgi:Ca2+-binding EF-hand superfamily protein